MLQTPQRLDHWVQPERVVDGLEGSSRQEILRGIAGILRQSLDFGSADEIYQRLEERERLGSTGVGRGYALPHCKLPGIAGPSVVVARSAAEIDFGSTDGVPVRVFFTVATPEGAATVHLTILAAIARWLKESDRGERLALAKSRDEMIAVLRESS